VHIVDKGEKKMGMVAMVHATRGALNAVEEVLSVAFPDADWIMLCQFTMAHLEERIRRETGMATISSLSLRSALQKVAALLEQPAE
jgi:hypothetical protein